MLHSSSSALLKKIVFAITIWLSPVIAFAEVSDKMPSLFSVWVTGIVFALICFVASYFLKWYGLLIAIIPLMFFVLHYTETLSGDMGRALYNEQGAAYFIQSYLAAFLVLIGVIAGVFLNKKLKNAP